MTAKSRRRVLEKRLQREAKKQELVTPSEPSKDENKDNQEND